MTTARAVSSTGGSGVIDPIAARRIRWVGFDVDGVLTDGGVLLGDVDGRRVELKRYDIQDGLGILLLRMAGIKVGIVTGRVSESVRLRASELGVDDLVQDPRARKLPALRTIAANRALALDEMAFVGDDLPDVPALRAVGLAAVVDNATSDLRDLGHVRLSRAGGAGAVREFSELLLRARGEWDDARRALRREPGGGRRAGRRGTMTAIAAMAAPSSRPATSLSDADLLEIGRQVLALEGEAVRTAGARLDEEFARAVRLVARARGRVIVAGVGKSGHVARKIAATLTSTGTAATFLHPVEGLHGDLGIVGPDDVALLLSKSGETAELLPLLQPLERFGVPTVAIVGRLDSTLGRHCDVVLDASVREEACPHDLAPTTSTTVALAIGDALAVALLQANGFRREDFARLHPGGALGQRLLTRVSDVMVTRDLPTLGVDATMRDAVVALSRGRGIVGVIDADGRLAGVLTSGDLTRLVERVEAFAVVPVVDVMNRSPKVATADEFGSAVVYRMERIGIIAMPVIDAARHVMGIVHLHDLLRAGAA